MIILEPRDRDYVIELIRKHPSGKPWDDKRILGKFEDDVAEKERMAICEHLPGSYIGKKDCCVKCGSFYESGMGFSWEVNKEQT